MSTGDSLIYLKDFTHWFDQLPLRAPSVSKQTMADYRTEIERSISEEVELTGLPLEEIRAATRPSGGDEFRITLDGGTYYDQYDFSFAMTRSVMRFRDVIGGRSLRIAREGSGMFWTQVDTLREAYGKKCEIAGRDDIPVVLCDDGVDSGQSVSELIRQLGVQYVRAERVCVVLNPQGHEAIDGVPVESVRGERGFLWTHERDFFWGSPGGGVSLCDRRNMNSLSGVPYSLSTQLLTNRIGFSGDIATLRRKILEVNLAFWQTLSEAAGRSLRVKDVPRLSWASELDSEFTPYTPITDLISWVLKNDHAI